MQSDMSQEPDSTGFTLLVTGQPNYNSVAVAVKDCFKDCFLKLDNVGGDRRLWVLISPSLGTRILWLVFYLPPNHEEMWHHEVACIDADIVKLQELFADRGQSMPPLLISGDANVQPSCLGKGPDPKPAREQALLAVMRKWSLTLCNTPSCGEAPIEISLPRRRKKVWATSCDTHHCNGGPGASRALDLFFASPGIATTLMVHNGVHCKNNCTWDDCNEFTGGDHFLIEAAFEDHVIEAPAPAEVSLPAHWHEPALWEHGLNCARGVLTAFESLSDGFSSLISMDDVRKSSPPKWITWSIDVLVLIFYIIEACIRDVWVLFAAVDKRKKARVADRAPSDGGHLRDEDELESFLKQARRDHAWPQSSVRACLKWLKPVLPRPPARLVHNHCLLSKAQSHAAWVQQLRGQGKWPDSFNTQFHDVVSSKARQVSNTARAHIGDGPWDSEISFAEWYRAARNIQSSRAITPFLINRVVISCEKDEWCKAAWKLQKLCGPSLLCWRPWLWRHRFLTVKYKKGPVAHEASFRFLAVADIHGMLQEEILLARLGGIIHSSLDDVQTGYRYDMFHHQLTLSILQDDYRHFNRTLFVVFADFVHAFPRAWRDLLLVEARETAGIRDGALALLAAIMKQDAWRVALSGTSVVTLTEGIPEGSKYGPQCFCLLPNTLVKKLREEKCGIATCGWVPDAWAAHVWSGSGTPDQAAAESIAQCIRLGHPIPSARSLRECPNCEATCARALDLLQADRVPVLLHADDPVFVASSRGEATRTLQVIASWAIDVKVELHLGSSKTVVQILHPPGYCNRAVARPLLFPRRPPLFPAPLEEVKVHKWLGLRWAASGEWMPHAVPLIAQCSYMVDILCSLTKSKRIPLAVAAILFELKIEASLRFGRWIWGLDAEACAALTLSYERWSRQLVGAGTWRNAAVCYSEIGWSLGALATVTVDVAAVRALLWQQGDATLAGRMFLSGHQSAASNWCKRSLENLSSQGILDWPLWVLAGKPRECYKRYVRGILARAERTRLEAAVATHRFPIAYGELVSQPCTMLKEALALRSPWKTLIGHRALIMLRCGYVALGHVGGHQSQAKVQACVFCQRRYSNVVFHVVCSCGCFAALRQECLALGADFSSLRVLATPICHDAHHKVVQLAEDICARAQNFWGWQM